MSERTKHDYENQRLLELREAIPFLKEIPDEVYFRLATSEFYLPTGETARVRSDLEQQLGHYIMTYNADVLDLSVPVERHLCANVKGAELTVDQLELLNEYESRVRSRGISLVVYQRPLELIQPEDSELAQLYRERATI